MAKRYWKHTETKDALNKQLKHRIATILGFAAMVWLLSGSVRTIVQAYQDGNMIVAGAVFMAIAMSVGMYIMSEPLLVIMMRMSRWPDGTGDWDTIVKASRNAGLRRPPRVYTIPTDKVNAMAFGVHAPIFGGRGAVALTKGLLNKLSDEESTAVLAHELTHIKSFDMVTITLAGVIIMLATSLPRMLFFGGRRKKIGSIGGLGAAAYAASEYIPSDFEVDAALIWLTILGLVVLPAIRAWISRQREYWADAGAAMIIETPEPMINALERLRDCNSAMPGAFTGLVGIFASFPVSRAIFKTHPSIDDRIASLRDLCDGK